MLPSLLADERHGSLPGMLLVLTAVTGVVDAVSIISLGRVFVANMTGNVVFIGFALVGIPGFALGASLSALAGFLVGAATGGRATTCWKVNRVRLLAVVVTGETVGAAVALILVAISSSHLSSATKDGAAVVLGMSLGAQNAAVRALGVPDLTTTVLTMTLTGLAADIRAGLHAAAQRRLAAVALMFGGAVAGAVLIRQASPAWALALATFLLGAVAAAAWWVQRRPAAWQRPL